MVILNVLEWLNIFYYIVNELNKIIYLFLSMWWSLMLINGY